MVRTHETVRHSSLIDTTAIDTTTSRAVCEGVGERLRDTLRKDPPYSRHIAELITRLEAQDWIQSTR